MTKDKLITTEFTVKGLEITKSNICLHNNKYMESVLKK